MILVGLIVNTVAAGLLGGMLLTGRSGPNAGWRMFGWCLFLLNALLVVGHGLALAVQS